MTLGLQVGLGPGHIVLDGDPAPPPPQKGGTANVYCGQTAGCISIPHGMEVDLGPGNTVLDGNPAPTSPKRAQPPIFGPCPLWPNGWMDEDVTWYRSRPRPRPHCVRRRPSSAREAQQTPLFSAYVYCGHGHPSQLRLSSS